MGLAAVWLKYSSMPICNALSTCMVEVIHMVHIHVKPHGMHYAVMMQDLHACLVILLALQLNLLELPSGDRV